MATHSLRRIPISELRLGMRLHRLDGSWLSHPFWKSRFVLEDVRDLERLRASGITACWVEDALAPAAAEDTRTVSEAPGPAWAPDPTPPCAAVTSGASAAPAECQPGVELPAEMERATEIYRRGREAVQAIFHQARLGRAIDVEGCLPLVQDITASVTRHPDALVSLARLKTQDGYTYMHSMAVCVLMVALARQLGLGDAACRAAGIAGLMHDIGKVRMPQAVLNKPGRLTDSELALMRTHPERGHELLLGGGEASAETLDVALHHHEKMDGSGYPHRLEGEQISLLARMGAVCDVYDAVTSNRPYKIGWDPAESLSRMASWSGHFDPDVFAAFVRSLGIYPIGSVVRLASRRLAVVVSQNPGALLAPVVKVFHCTRTERALPPATLDLSAAGCADRITAREGHGGGSASALDALWLDPNLLERVRGA